jgi:hypothetical protein
MIFSDMNFPTLQLYHILDHGQLYVFIPSRQSAWRALREEQCFCWVNRGQNRKIYILNLQVTDLAGTLPVRPADQKSVERLK